MDSTPDTPTPSVTPTPTPSVTPTPTPSVTPTPTPSVTPAAASTAPPAAPEARTAPAVFGLAPRVSLTRLPFGGAVLVHGVSLALAECSEHDAHALDRLLELDVDGWRMAPAHQRRMAEELTAAGWLARTAGAEDTRSRAGHNAERRTGASADGSATARTAAQGG